MQRRMLLPRLSHPFWVYACMHAAFFKGVRLLFPEIKHEMCLVKKCFLLHMECWLIDLDYILQAFHMQPASSTTSSSTSMASLQIPPTRYETFGCYY